jgi:neutral ceramidase
VSRAALCLYAVLHVFALALVGCSPLKTPAPLSPTSINEGPDLRAGIARVDITPPPGLSLFGHGPEGRVSVGTLLRLYCEAFVFTKESEAIALVPCDIGAPSQELQREVADRVVKSGVPLGADRILLMATHTHAGPSHYFGTKQYSSTFSSRAPGFDPKVLAFLADRIATAVRVAYKSRVRAKLSWRINAMGGDGLVKNRSFEAFLLNNDLPKCLKDRVDEVTTSGSVSAALAATDKTLSVLRIDRDEGPGARPSPMGAFVVFGIHNTAIPNTNDVYHSDVFGFALRQVEAKLTQEHKRAGDGSAATGDSFIVGIANGIEGDVSPTVGYRSVAEARRLGDELADRIAKAYNGEGPAVSNECAYFDIIEGQDDLARVYRELYLPGALAGYLIPTESHPVSRPVYLCNAPEIGSAAAGGAEDGPTRFRVFPEMNEGARAPHRKCQGRKLPIRAPPGVPFTDDGIDFPNTAPIALVRLGGVTIAAAPFEMTTVVGIRIREALEKELNAKRHVVVVGLTNSYLQYVTTAEEYAQQNYEGASTFYGVWTGEFLKNHFVCLARSMGGGPRLAPPCDMDQDRVINKVYPLAYNPDAVSRMPDPVEDEEEHIALKNLEVKETTQDRWPAWVIRFPGLPLGETTLRERQRVRIIEDASGKVCDDDTGMNIEVRYDLTAADRRTWIARWVPRLKKDNALCSATVHFEVESAGRLISSSFQVKCDTSSMERSSDILEQQKQPKGPPSPEQPPSSPSAPQDEGSSR